MTEHVVHHVVQHVEVRLEVLQVVLQGHVAVEGGRRVHRAHQWAALTTHVLTCSFKFLAHIIDAPAVSCDVIALSGLELTVLGASQMMAAQQRLRTRAAMGSS